MSFRMLNGGLGHNCPRRLVLPNLAFPFQLRFQKKRRTEVGEAEEEEEAEVEEDGEAEEEEEEEVEEDGEAEEETEKEAEGEAEAMEIVQEGWRGMCLEKEKRGGVKQ